MKDNKTQEVKDNAGEKSSDTKNKTPNSKQRGRRNNSKGSRNRGKYAKPVEDKIGIGDRNPYYYAADDKTIDMFTQLSMNVIGGKPIPVGPTIELTNSNILRVPMSINITGNSESNSSTFTGINAATRKLYQELTAFTGRAASSYTASDLGIMLCSFASLLEWVSFAKRIYGSYRLYSPFNRSFNRAVLAAQGIVSDQTTVFNNLKYLNTVIDQMGSLVIPACPMLIKSLSMYDELYLDDDSDLGQLIVYVPEYYHVLDETGATGSIAKAYAFTPIADETQALATFKDVIDIIKMQLDALMNSATLHIVFADLINYANKIGSLTTITILPCELDYTAPVRYSHEEIMKLHNARFLGEPKLATYMNIISNVTTDLVYQNPTFKIASAQNTDLTMDENVMLNNSGVANFGIMDFSDPNVDAKMMIEASRFIMMPKNFFYNGNDQTVECTYHTGGDHIIMKMVLCKVNNDGSLGFNAILRTTLGLFAVSNNGSAIDNDSRAKLMFTQLSAYQCAPNIFVWDGNVASTATPKFVTGRLSFYKVYDKQYINTLNDRIFQYMFSVLK